MTTQVPPPQSPESEKAGIAARTRGGISVRRVLGGVVLTLLAVVLALSAWHRFVVAPLIHAGDQPVDGLVETEELRNLSETKEELERIVSAAARSSAPSGAGGKPSDVDDRVEQPRQ